MKKREMVNALNARYYKARSAWSRGVLLYAAELLDNIKEDEKATEARLLNGARDWKEYSEGGCSLVYDEDICKRLSAPWEIKKTHNGERRPNKQENWLDVQARALYQASRIVIELADAI